MAARGAIDFASAYARLRRDPSFQFALRPAPPNAPAPGWLIALFRTLGHALQFAEPVFRVGVWVVLGAVALIVAALILRRRGGRSRVVPRPPLNLHGIGVDPARSAAKAVARLSDADRLAAEGRYDEAIHHLLLTGVDEVERVRPGRIGPSFTSRDIATLAELPADARAAFTRIVAAVEEALFGGRAVDAEGWERCRQAFAALTRHDAWNSAPGSPSLPDAAQ